MYEFISLYKVCFSNAAVSWEVPKHSWLSVKPSKLTRQKSGHLNLRNPPNKTLYPRLDNALGEIPKFLKINKEWDCWAKIRYHSSCFDSRWGREGGFHWFWVNSERFNTEIKYQKDSSESCANQMKDIVSIDLIWNDAKFNPQSEKSCHFEDFLLIIFSA